MATDPVCGMYVDERTAELKLIRESRTYYFCSTRCLHEFSQPERELASLRRKLVVGWPLSLLVIWLTYAYHFPNWPWVAFGLASVVQFYPGLQFFRSTLDAIRARNWNMDVLIAVGTTVAYLYSAAALVLPRSFPQAFYFDASSLIVTLILTGNYLEHLTRERARGALRKLKELLPTTAFVIRNGAEVEIPISEVLVGDRLRVRPGAYFPTDGTILEGRSSAIEAVLTGESLPVEKGPGSAVIAGAVNGEGLLVVEAKKVGEDTFLAQISQMVAEAETSRVPLQQLADRIAAIFVPVVFVLAVGASLGWLFFGVGLTVSLLVFVSVVITACPCAFGIATPAALVVGTGRAADEGILFKGRDSLERASRVDVVLSDKTGTLTRGQPSMTDVLPAPGITETELLALVGGVEAGSEHPLAKAVVEGVRERGITTLGVEDVRADPGNGVRAIVSGVPVAVLQGRAVREAGIELGGLNSAAERLTNEGKAWSVVVRGGSSIGLLGFFDQVAPGVADSVRALAQDGIAVVMVTGDHEVAARAVARQVGILEVHSGMTPRGKLAEIREHQSKGERVAFVGDGINDAPALSAADLGIAVGAGTDVAREAGGVVLIRSDFRGVALALRVGRRTVRKVRSNLLWALGYNALLLPVAMGVLVPVFGLGMYRVLPITGALAMALSSTSVVLNSVSLRWISLGPVSRTTGRAGDTQLA